MVTLVGTQTEFLDAVKDLIELDYDAAEAYDAAINRLENNDYKEKLRQFKEDHDRHTRELTNLVQKHGEEAPDGPSGKQWLTKGKVVLADLMGDKAILMAMRSNEIDTNTAYDRLLDHEGMWDDAREIIKKGFEDEKHHKAWFDEILGH
ncbi:MAG: DUF2383 domain-containing protein [Sphingobacteriia bacterium]|nr:DUF2383 domain-containing protein [Sphingobacteriia bacterium]